MTQSLLRHVVALLEDEGFYCPRLHHNVPFQLEQDPLAPTLWAMLGMGYCYPAGLLAKIVLLHVFIARSRIIKAADLSLLWIRCRSLLSKNSQPGTCRLTL